MSPINFSKRPNIGRRIKALLATTVFASCIGFLGSHAQTAQEEAQAQQNLEAVASAIEGVRSWLDEANRDRSREEQALRTAELELTRLADATRKTRSDVASIRDELKQLELQSEQLYTAKVEQMGVINKLVRAAYMRGEPGFLKSMFGSQDLHGLRRTLHYTSKLSEFQLQKISQFETTLNEIAEAEILVERKLDALNEQDAVLLQQLSALEIARTKKQQTLTTLRSNIASKGAELDELEANQSELQQLIEQIRTAMEGVSSFADVPPLEDSKGQLLPPVSGPVVTGFGQTYGDGSLQRQGIIWQAETGTPVTAIHPGQVVFSDWLRGSGLLLIVDHGEGYMSLYGNNEALSASAGDWVDAGDVLATSGTSISTGEAGLYFEIRYRGQPQDPSAWLDLGR